MDEAERLMFLGWSRMPAFQKKIKESDRIIREALNIAPAHVSVSWGKDSLVLAHLVWTIDPSVLLIHVGDQYQDKLDNYEEVETDFLSRFPCTYKKVNLGLKNAKQTFAKIAHGIPPMGFIGLRSEESRDRRISLMERGVIYKYKQGRMRACPLAWWGWKDVWAYIVAHDLAYLASYDHPANEGKERSRTSVHVGRGRGATVGRFEQLRRINPDYYALIKDQIIGEG